MRRNRIAKTLQDKLKDLDSHLYLLREHRQGLSENATHLKAIAAELRTLICFSSETEGLLWRLADELGVDDPVYVHAVGKLQHDHLMTQGLQFYCIPIVRGGKGDPKLPPHNRSFRDLIRNSESLFAAGKPITYEYLIKAVSQQIGTAHEDDGLEPALVELRSIMLNGVEPFEPVLLTATEYTLEIGERVVVKAEEQHHFQRARHTHRYGNTSLALRLRVVTQLGGRVPLAVFRSYVANVDINCSAGPAGVSFSILKSGRLISDIVAQYPTGWQPGAEVLFVLSYCSYKQQARTFSNDTSSDISSLDGVGWIHAGDLLLEHNNTDHIDLVEKKFVLCYERLLSADDARSLYELPSNGYGLWTPSYEAEGQSPFPDD